jgi:hypothetical protein
MLKLLFLSALLLFTPSRLHAEDPVLFFDGPAHGWKITDTYFSFERNDYEMSAGRKIFAGVAKGKKEYVYYFDTGKKDFVHSDKLSGMLLFHREPGGRFDTGPLIGNQNHFGEPASPFESYSNFLDQINYETDGYYEDIGYDIRYLWNVFLLGREKKYYKDDNKKAKSTYIDYNFELNLDDDKNNLYIKSSGKNGFFYKIPENMRRTIIIRDRLVYVPNRFLKSAIVKIPICPKSTTLGFTAERVEACLSAFFHSLPKGDYDADTPYPIPAKQ